jgi:DNA repair protein RadA/Sms
MGTHRLNIGNPNVTLETNILDLTIPKELEKNVSTGLTHIDALCAGDGITPSTVILLTGLAGAGKSSLALQIANSITKQGHIALYNTNEESLYQIRKTVKRLKFEHGFVPAYKSETHELIEYAEEARLKNLDKQLFLFVDSLQTIEFDTNKKQGRGRPMGQQAAAVETAWELAAWAKKTYAIVILIGQVTKDGTFAGKQEIKHAIDMHISMTIDSEKKSDTYNERIVEVEKNRMGLAGIYLPYKINSDGIEFVTA